MPRKAIPKRIHFDIPAHVKSGLADSELEAICLMAFLEAEFVDNPVFHNQKEAGQLMAQNVPETEFIDKFQVLKNEERAEPAETLTMDREQEIAIFRQYNYCRFRWIQSCNSVLNTLGAAREAIFWFQKAKSLRNQIVSLNLPLVMAMAKRTRISGVDFSDLISDGNMALLRAVDKFNANRGFKFSTYACRAILKSFSRTANLQRNYRKRFPMEFDPSIEYANPLDTIRQKQFEMTLSDLKELLERDVSKILNDVQERVIRARFGIIKNPVEGESYRPMTLEEIGNIIGVTKERVRQIQNMGLLKLRRALGFSSKDPTTTDAILFKIKQPSKCGCRAKIIKLISVG